MNFLLKNIDAKKSLLFILSLIFLDQFVKFFIKLNYPISTYGEPKLSGSPGQKEITEKHKAINNKNY